MRKTCHAYRDTYEEADTAQRLRKAEPAVNMSRAHHPLRLDDFTEVSLSFEQNGLRTA
jgi:hypothetical protein